MKRHFMIATVLTAMCGVAQAQDTDPTDDVTDPDTDSEENQKNDSDAPTPTSVIPPTTNLPPPQSDDDPQPEVPTPVMPGNGAMVEQAGVGGVIGYGRAGVLELGGSAGFSAGAGFTDVSVAPSIGWFVADNFELTGILDMEHVRTDGGSGTIATVLAEPSVHLPFNKTTFGFFGIGVGGAYVSGPGLAFAMAPRVGANFLVGRSGILTPSLSWQYNTHESMTTGDTVLLQVSSAVRANIGYTVMW